jgi:urease alpha subunit
VALGEWNVDLRCRVVRLERPAEVGYEIFAGDLLMLRLIQHVTPVSRGSELRWSCEAVDERLDPVLVRHHLNLSLQRFEAMLEPIATA